MAIAELYYEGININIQCNQNDKMQQIFQKFLVKANINKNSAVFIYNGNDVSNNELTFYQLCNSVDKKRNKMNILVSN